MDKSINIFKELTEFECLIVIGRCPKKLSQVVLLLSGSIWGPQQPSREWQTTEKYRAGSPSAEMLQTSPGINIIMARVKPVTLTRCEV